MPPADLAVRDPLIAVRNLRLALGGAAIFSDLNFTVAAGEFVCILGPSGCGKSTTLRLLGDLLDGAAGEIRIDGRDPAATWSRIAYVFQSPRLLPWKTALDNAAFGLELRHPEIKPDERRRRAMAQLARVGLNADAGKMPAMLSGGEKQRVAIARALALDPEIILMDEPFSALDPDTRVRLRRQLLDLWRDLAKTVVFVTHDIDEALFLADRILVLTPKPGRVVRELRVAAARPRDIEHDPQLRSQRGELLALFQSMGEAIGGNHDADRPA